MDADRLDAAILDRTEKSAEAIDERLAADKADIFMVSACQSRCSPEPKPISSQTSSTGVANSLVKGEGGGCLEVEAQTRQQLADQPLLPRA